LQRGGLALTLEELRMMRDEKVGLDERINIETIELDMDAPAEERALQYLEQIRNPYAFRCGDLAVNVRYKSDGKELREGVKAYLSIKVKGKC
jgi:hypothetical protein